MHLVRKSGILPSLISIWPVPVSWSMNLKTVFYWSIASKILKRESTSLTTHQRVVSTSLSTARTNSWYSSIMIPILKVASANRQ